MVCWPCWRAQATDSRHTCVADFAAGGAASGVHTASTAASRTLAAKRLFMSRTLTQVSHCPHLPGVNT
jgi:hypothetical protein